MRILLVLSLAIPPAALAAGPAEGGGEAVAETVDGGERTGRLRGEARTRSRRPVAYGTVVAIREKGQPVLAMTAVAPNGFIAMDRLPGGTYRVTVSAQDHLDRTIDGVGVSGPFRSVVDFVMEPGEGERSTLELPAGEGPARIVARVEDDEGAPLPGVRLVLEPVDQRRDPVSVESDEQGLLAVDGPLEGLFRMTIDRAGWTRLARERVRFAGGELRLVARLLPLEGSPDLTAVDLLPRPTFTAPPSEPLVNRVAPDLPTDENPPPAEGLSETEGSSEENVESAGEGETR